MSIALDRNGGGGNNMIQRSRFIHGGMPCLSMYDSSETKGFAQDRRLVHDLDSCSSSSVGNNSDSSDGSSDGDDETEIQSSFKGPLDTMDQLEEVLPVKRGISKFYSGKSKSFTSLADISSVASVKDLAKPKNPYTKKRKNLLVHSNFQDRNCNHSSKNNGGVISKRAAASSSRGAFRLGETLSSSHSYSNEEGSHSISPASCLPPLHPPLHPHAKRSPGNESSPPLPRRNSPWRSFSLSDLQCAAAATPNITGLAICSGKMDNNLH